MSAQRESVASSSKDVQDEIKENIDVGTINGDVEAVVKPTNECKKGNSTPKYILLGLVIIMAIATIMTLLSLAMVALKKVMVFLGIQGDPNFGHHISGQNGICVSKTKQCIFKYNLFKNYLEGFMHHNQTFGSQ